MSEEKVRHIVLDLLIPVALGVVIGGAVALALLIWYGVTRG